MLMAQLMCYILVYFVEPSCVDLALQKASSNTPSTSIYPCSSKIGITIIAAVFGSRLVMYCVLTLDASVPY